MRKPRINANEFKYVMENYTIRNCDLAKVYGVSDVTIHRYVNDYSNGTLRTTDEKVDFSRIDEKINRILGISKVFRSESVDTVSVNNEPKNNPSESTKEKVVSGVMGKLSDFNMSLDESNSRSVESMLSFLGRMLEKNKKYSVSINVKEL